MCLPLIAAIPLVIGAAEAVAGGIAQDKAAHGNKAAAVQAHISALADLSEREVEESIAAVNQKQTAERQARSVVGTTITAAAEAGVGGQSVAAVLHQVEADRAQFDERTDVNLATEKRQLAREHASADASMQSRINSVPGNNWLATGLRIGGEIAGAFTSMPSVDAIATASRVGPTTTDGAPALPYIPYANPSGNLNS